MTEKEWKKKRAEYAQMVTSGMIDDKTYQAYLSSLDNAFYSSVNKKKAQAESNFASETFEKPKTTVADVVGGVKNTIGYAGYKVLDLIDKSQEKAQKKKKERRESNPWRQAMTREQIRKQNERIMRKYKESI